MSNVLDTPPANDPSGVSFWPTAIRFGLIGGLISIVYQLIGSITGFASTCAGMFAPAIFGLGSLIITVLVLVYGLRSHRNELGGYMTFGRAFMVGFVITLIMSILGQLFSYLYLTFIDPDMITNMIDCTRDRLEEMGMEGADLDDQMARMERQFENQTSIVRGLGISAIASAVFAAIMGLIMKKNVPETM